MEGWLSLTSTCRIVFIFALVAVCVESALIPDLPVFVTPKQSNGVPRSTPAQEEIGSPLRVAQCRATCLQRFSSGSDRESSCMQGPDCFMCWENCALLQSNYPVWGAMCSEKKLCFPGCQQACRFHHDTASLTQQVEPVILTHGEEVLQVSPLSSGAAVVYWKPAPPPRHRHVVYVLMAKPAEASTWRQISQSVECEALLEADTEVLNPGTTVRVMVVDPEGLVTIYSPTPQTTQPPSTTTVPASTSESLPVDKRLQEATKEPAMDLFTILAPSNPSIQPSGAPSSTSTTASPPTPWLLREVSLLHQRILVIAELAWNPQARHGVYLVTWELDGGGLRGNLFTDSTSVTLSLWPNTVYHIQVELVSHGSGKKSSGPDRSEPLIIDTWRAPQVQDVETSMTPPAAPAAASSGDPGASAEFWSHVAVQQAEQGSPKRLRRHFSQEMLAGTGAAMLLFLIIATAMAWRCHRARSLGRNKRRLLLADDSISAGMSPPIVSVMAPKDCKNPLEGWQTPPSTIPTVSSTPSFLPVDGERPSRHHDLPVV